jgi:hypothetical protein
MSAFDIPIHTKNISTRDFAVRHETEAPAARKERAPPQASHVASAALVSTLTLSFALRQAVRGELHPARKLLIGIRLKNRKGNVNSVLSTLFVFVRVFSSVALRF